MDAVDAFWVVELNCYCPGCHKYVDMLEHYNFVGDAGIDVAEHGTDRTTDMEVSCPACGHEFKITCCF